MDATTASISERVGRYIHDGRLPMSFRTRLTTFFVVIVIVPMGAFGATVFRLISQSDQGRGDARASGVAAAAAGVYASSSNAARKDAVRIGRAVAGLDGPALSVRVAALARQAGLARVLITRDGHPILNFGSQQAVAPGVAIVTRAGFTRTTIAASELSASELARELAGRGVAVVVRSRTRILASSIHLPRGQSISPSGTVSIGSVAYRVVTETLTGFAGRVQVVVLSNLAATSSTTGSEALALGFIGAFLILAFLFAVLASRQLGGQMSRFLEAARRLGQGDFSSPIPVEGRDEFAALGEEFNRMSRQLESRIEELAKERARLRRSIGRIGETFASNLDRQALLEVALHAAMDAAQADCGRLTAREAPDHPLAERARVGSLDDLEDYVLSAESKALEGTEIVQAGSDGLAVAACRLGTFAGGKAQAVVTVGRRAGEPFSDDEREILRSLASQAIMALENVDLHHQIRRQAATDELTGLSNHGHFQEQLTHQIEEVHRYHRPVGLLMIDIDNFKSINDTHGHPQGDLVLTSVARVLRQTSREVDVPARYGGEEMAVILPHTDLEGACSVAERIRESVEKLAVPRLDGAGQLRVTVSVGVASAVEGDKESLIAQADGALYAAKRGGKNRTVGAHPEAVIAVGE